MDDHKELARRLTVGLEQLPSHSIDAGTAEALKSLAKLSDTMHQHIAALPHEARLLIHTADSGFTSSGQWVDAAIKEQTQQLKKLARATGMVATWVEAEDNSAERMFVIRGNIRGWAHRWRQEDKGTAQVESDPDFVTFASNCLTQAGIAGEHRSIIAGALGSDWRTAANS